MATWRSVPAEWPSEKVVGGDDFLVFPQFARQHLPALEQIGRFVRIAANSKISAPALPDTPFYTIPDEIARRYRLERMTYEDFDRLILIPDDEDEED